MQDLVPDPHPALGDITVVPPVRLSLMDPRHLPSDMPTQHNDSVHVFVNLPETCTHVMPVETRLVGGDRLPLQVLIHTAADSVTAEFVDAVLHGLMQVEGNGPFEVIFPLPPSIQLPALTNCSGRNYGSSSIESSEDESE